MVVGATEDVVMAAVEAVVVPISRGPRGGRLVPRAVRQLAGREDTGRATAAAVAVVVAVAVAGLTVASSASSTVVSSASSTVVNSASSTVAAAMEATATAAVVAVAARAIAVQVPAMR